MATKTPINLEGAVRGKVVVITGASSGIGLVARPHHRRRDRRHRPLLCTRKARLLRPACSTHPPIRPRPTAQRPAQQVRLTTARLGGGRSSATGLARHQPLASALPRRRKPVPAQQRRQGRRRAQDPHRRLAHALPQRTLQARAAHNQQRLCPGKLPLCFGRLTARYGIEKPGQLPSTRCATNAKKEMSTPVREQHRR